MPRWVRIQLSEASQADAVCKAKDLRGVRRWQAGEAAWRRAAAAVKQAGGELCGSAPSWLPPLLVQP